ncbi:sec-independent protein translocase protein TatA [Amycolatopsis mediterranei S699]|uniref:Sec-independent protein translocase protein TatA n=2 Tax=Amycolatopsis mediterranei TaxID=33910 RepID=A0A0H3D995_AMYMU|nr:Sec-independent protein translocase subunit TatA [Amycolatopsis mediterranei]ADJ46648.1 sec-independent protein translocase protein TatA [Amycolatopsis mediterranei U32]AEK43448.1 sec-independent protein translocase protein TatA [Amycolatopsis mediterranei S699]AFO78359.1 sec-independent protein translocase protein TatA [Amycolatopsis mediterranei S699]AGT85487.1 sec-independent protein translocase protein TatA [Amycolatopsis mediterranei RB]KDO11450.1 preprotein translocase subunit TatA [A
MLNGLQPWHLIILVLVVVLLFGAKRLPDAARSIGKSMKIFKAETKDLTGDKAHEDAEPVETKQIPATPAAPASTDQQVADLQRQLDELKKQQAAEQPQKNVS